MPTTELDPKLGTWGRKITIYYGRHYASVELNRDNWVDRHRGQDQEEISAEFKAAVDRCQEAGVWRVWVNGYNGGFGYSSGPRWITLFVPPALADEAVAALKAAELRGDLSRLDRLATKMTPPFEVWLAPGERYLRLGADFTCTPRRFLDTLRGKARRMGLKLNGRADENGVWVRPERSASEKLLRQAFPERYDTEPDPYLNVEVGDTVRPPAPYRHRSSPAKSEPQFLDAPNPGTPPTCPCGWESHGEQHGKWHLNWANGVPIPSQLIFPHRVAVIDTMAPKMWRNLAYECARVAQRDGGYDFPSFDHGGDDPEPGTYNLRAYLFRARGQVVGYLSVVDRVAGARWDLHSSKGDPTEDRTIRPSINLVFVADMWRRRGIATAMLAALGAHSGREVTELAWCPPFTDAGKALARKVSPGGVWLS